MDSGTLHHLGIVSSGELQKGQFLIIHSSAPRVTKAQVGSIEKGVTLQDVEHADDKMVGTILRVEAVQLPFIAARIVDKFPHVKTLIDTRKHTFQETNIEFIKTIHPSLDFELSMTEEDLYKWMKDKLYNMDNYQDNLP